jgi:hypothetical protein
LKYQTLKDVQSKLQKWQEGQLSRNTY